MAWKSEPHILKDNQVRRYSGIAEHADDYPDVIVTNYRSGHIKIGVVEYGGNRAFMSLSPAQARELAALLTEAASIADEVQS